MNPIQLLSAFIYQQAETYKKNKYKQVLKKYNFPDTISHNVSLTNPGNISIGNNSYMNSGQIVAGEKSKVIIGDWCAIGYNVHIKAQTHDVNRPTGPCRKIGDGIKEEDIIIGNHVWIGDNVYIKEGVHIGDDVIIGANSMVTKDFGDNVIIGGNPAHILRKRDTVRINNLSPTN